MLHSRFTKGSLALLVIMTLGYGWTSAFGWHRPYINWMPWRLAEYLAENHRSYRECLDLVWLEIMSPTATEQKALCIYEYAKLTQDPTACELLLPSDYGWDCLGNVASLLNTGFGCSSYATGEILCSSGIQGKNIGVNDCTNYREPDLRNWCLGERTRTIPGVNDCDKMPSDPLILRDECQRWYAYKQKDASLCSVIQSKGLQKICELKIKYAR